jgi:hypothetical protein
MLIPLEPNAGPTGGDGLAAPPLICSLISPAISLAIILKFDVFCGIIQFVTELNYSFST